MASHLVLINAKIRGQKLTNIFMSQSCLFRQSFPHSWTSLVAQLVKKLPARWETWVRSLGWKDPPKKGKATPPVFWPGEFHRLYSPWGRKEPDMTE